MFAPSIHQPIVHQYRVYAGASELRQMRLSPGSPLLAAVLAALSEPLSCWTVEDVGVDEQGVYELVIANDLCPCAGHLPGGDPARGETLFSTSSPGPGEAERIAYG